MDWTAAVQDGLRERDVRTIAHVPDSAIAPLIEELAAASGFELIDAAREEQAIGIASGVWLGGGRAAVLCQSSGLANTLNALGSLNKAARIPLLGIVTRRGGLGEFNYAQVPFGYNMPDVLDALGLRYSTVDDETDVERAVSWGAKTAFSTDEPYFLLLESTLLGVKE